jgi:DIE2/ALG10 family
LQARQDWVYDLIKIYLIDLGHQITELISILVKDFMAIIKRMWIYFSLLVVFLIFLWKNKGVVVGIWLFILVIIGDRSNHQFSFHPTQFLYLILFMIPNTGISLSHHLMNFRLSLIKIFYNRTLTWIFLLLTMVFMVIAHYFTYENSSIFYFQDRAPVHSCRQQTLHILHLEEFLWKILVFQIPIVPYLCRSCPLSHPHHHV